MAHKEQQDFCEKVKYKYPRFFKNKKVLDVGSLDINGSNKYLFTNCDYLGIDIGEGKNVDFISKGHEFEGPDEYYDVIISTEVFEHDMYYEKTIENIFRMLRTGGLFLFTCASTGRSEHGTRRSDLGSAPLLTSENNWYDYYKNITEEDIRNINGFNHFFPDGLFQFNETSCDLYFVGIKLGKEKLKYDL